MRHTIFFALCATACASNPAPQDIPDWRYVGFPTADSVAIKNVASQAGVRTPYSFAAPFVQIVGCPTLSVVSDTLIEGDRRSWTELSVYRTGRDTGGHRCAVYREDGDTLWQWQGWVASSAGREERSTWRIHDGSWYLDVRLGPGVTYQDATTIVRAVRHQELVDLRPAGLRRIPIWLRGALRDTLPTLDADSILSITTAKDRDGGTHDVDIGAPAFGYSLSVSIADGKVLVHNIGSYIS
jgi:hypothetical protein